MNQETFGSLIRRLREKKNMPLRRLAAQLDIDQSTLSKIETNQRQPTKEMVPVLARVFEVELKDLEIKFLSEKIKFQIKDEAFGLEALKAVELEFKKFYRNK